MITFNWKKKRTVDAYGARIAYTGKTAYANYNNDNIINKLIILTKAQVENRADMYVPCGIRTGDFIIVLKF